MEFFNSAVDVLQTLVVALGAGLAIWGVINLLEGYGNDNPGAKSQGMKQLMAGGGVALIGIVAFVCFAIALGTMVLLQDFPEGLRLMGLAWLISPFGLPLIAAFLVELLGVFNDSLKAI